MNAYTYAERLAAGLLADGWAEVPSASRYRTFAKLGGQARRFIGPNGAYRKGECATRSYSIGDAARQTPAYLARLAKGDHALGNVPAAPVADALATANARIAELEAKLAALTV